jgi:hypothetical protein
MQFVGEQSSSAVCAPGLNSAAEGRSRPNLGKTFISIWAAKLIVDDAL